MIKKKTNAFAAGPRLRWMMAFLAATLSEPMLAQGHRPVQRMLFTNVHIFDGLIEQRIENASVLVEGNLIKQVSTSPIRVDGAAVINGGGRTLMPGLNDAHSHVLYAGLHILDQLRADPCLSKRGGMCDRHRDVLFELQRTAEVP